MIHDCWRSSRLLCIHSCIDRHSTDNDRTARRLNEVIRKEHRRAQCSSMQRAWWKLWSRNHMKSWDSRMAQANKEDDKMNPSLCFTQEENLWISQEKECWEESSSSSNRSHCSSICKAKDSEEIIIAHDHFERVLEMVEWNHYLFTFHIMKTAKSEAEKEQVMLTKISQSNWKNFRPENWSSMNLIEQANWMQRQWLLPNPLIL